MFNLKTCKIKDRCEERKPSGLEIRAQEMMI